MFVGQISNDSLAEQTRIVIHTELSKLLNKNLIYGYSDVMTDIDNTAPGGAQLDFFFRLNRGPYGI